MRNTSRHPGRRARRPFQPQPASTHTEARPEGRDWRELGRGHGAGAIGSPTARHRAGMRGASLRDGAKPLGSLWAVHRLGEWDALGKRALPSRSWDMRMGTGGPIRYREGRRKAMGLSAPLRSRRPALPRAMAEPLPRKPMGSWGASRGVWAAGQERFSSPSALPWEGPIWSPVSSSGLPSSRKMRSYWRESSGGL